MPARSASTPTGCVITASPSWPRAGTWAQLLDIKPATLRNWIEADERAARPAGPDYRRIRPMMRPSCGGCARRVAELRRANEILKTASAFFAQAELDRRLK